MGLCCVSVVLPISFTLPCRWRCEKRGIIPHPLFPLYYNFLSFYVFNLSEPPPVATAEHDFEIERGCMPNVGRKVYSFHINVKIFFTLKISVEGNETGGFVLRKGLVVWYNDIVR